MCNQAIKEWRVQPRTRGWWNGLAGVLIFSGSLPATRLAVMGFDPFFLTGARAVIAGLLAAGLLLLGRERRPARADLVPLLLVALGCVVAFPLFTGLALRHISSAQAMVFIGALPLSTAVFAVLRGAERPRPAFWVFSLLGAALVGGYALAQGGVASVAQLQLLQPFFGLLLAGLLLGERVTPLMLLSALAVIVCVAGARRFSR